MPRSGATIALGGTGGHGMVTACAPGYHGLRTSPCVRSVRGNCHTSYANPLVIFCYRYRYQVALKELRAPREAS